MPRPRGGRIVVACGVEYHPPRESGREKLLRDGVDADLGVLPALRRHADVQRTAAGYIARDAGSLNGTYVNHERIDEAPLRQGDELQVGKFRLVFFERAQ